VINACAFRIFFLKKKVRQILNFSSDLPKMGKRAVVESTDAPATKKIKVLKKKKAARAAAEAQEEPKPVVSEEKPKKKKKAAATEAAPEAAPAEPTPPAPEKKSKKKEAPAPKADAADAEEEGASGYKDKELTCLDCSKTFNFSSGEQEFFAGPIKLVHDR
jgi:hypothetical protein